MFVLLTIVTAQIDPSHRTTLTLFHEYQPKFASAGLINQDTGDIDGDAYFVLRGLLLPIECANKSKHYPTFDCDNPEQNSTLNIVSQHTVAVDDRFGTYAPCDVDKKTGNYSCQCGGFFHHTPCKPPVGKVDVAKREVGHRIPPGSPDWMFWRTNLALKTGGTWYSTTSVGECKEDDDDNAPCTWKLVSTKRRIVAACLEERIAVAIQAYEPKCFGSCAQPKNASTPCVARCYMETLLGPDGGSKIVNGTSEGMPKHLIEEAWEKAFETDAPAKGGCPEAPPPAAPQSAMGVVEEWPYSWRVRAPRF